MKVTDESWAEQVDRADKALAASALSTAEERIAELARAVARLDRRLPRIGGGEVSTLRATSALADLRLTPERKASDRERILAYLRSSARGATDQELQEVLGLDGSTERPRRQELERAGAIVDSGLTRRTRSGALAIVWSVRL